MIKNLMIWKSIGSHGRLGLVPAVLLLGEEEWRQLGPLARAQIPHLDFIFIYLFIYFYFTKFIPEYIYLSSDALLP